MVIVELNTQELVAEMMDGVTYKYWTYNGTVPGPFLRVKEGDDVEVRLSHGVSSEEGHGSIQVDSFATIEETNSFLGTQIAYADSGHMQNGVPSEGGVSMMHEEEGHGTHSIDLHSVIGPGGGALLTQVGHEGPKAFRFKATRPGIYVYHCASPHVPTHIANGMYGMILVEPKEGITEVDKEFYVMQGDFYTEGKFGELGHQEFSKERLLNENPSYFVFNGRVGGLMGERAMKAKVGDRVRMYVGVGSHMASNFHIIGGIFEELYRDGAITDPPLHNVQTTVIPVGGAIMIEFTVEVPGKYLLVDHSLTRAFDKGALAELVVEGNDVPELYSEIIQ